MSKARVSLSAVSVFHKNTDVMKTAADRIIMALTSIDQCITLINRERLKLDNEVSNVSKSMVSIENKISIIKKEIVKIQAKLSDLNIQLANTEKTIEVEHTCRIGTDENGNPEYSTYTTIEPNPAYLALEAEIDAVSHQLEAMKTKNDQANSINSQLNGTKQNLQKNKDSLALSQQELNKIKGEIQTGASQISKCSASASMVLGKAEKAIQKYLNENIGTVSRSHVAVVAHYGPQNYSSMTTNPKESHIFDCNRSDYLTYHYAREAVSDTKKYIDNIDTPKHEYTSCHLNKEGLPGNIDWTAEEWAKLDKERKKAEQLSKSHFYDDITYDNFKQLIVVGLLNSRSIENHANENSIYQAKFPYCIGRTIGETKQFEDTQYLTIVIGRDRKTQERIISAYPGRSRQAIRAGIE